MLTTKAGEDAKDLLLFSDLESTSFQNHTITTMIFKSCYSKEIPII